MVKPVEKSKYKAAAVRLWVKGRFIGYQGSKTREYPKNSLI